MRRAIIKNCSAVAWTAYVTSMGKAIQMRHMALSDNYRQISQKRNIFTGKIYLAICVEWAGDHFGLGLT